MESDFAMEKKIAKRIDKMNILERRILVSYYYNEMSLSEISEELDIPYKTVADCLQHSACLLKGLMEHEGARYMAMEILISMAEEAVSYEP